MFCSFEYKYCVNHFAFCIEDKPKRPWPITLTCTIMQLKPHADGLQQKSKFVSNFLQKETIKFQIMLFVLHASHNVYPIIWTLDYKEFISNQYHDVQISCKSVLHMYTQIHLGA